MNKLLCFVFVCLVLAGALPFAAATATIDKSIVVLHTNHGDITLELYDTDAPDTVDNFLDYVEDGFYTGLIFHRVIDDFMIQAGAYDTDLYDVEDFSVGVFSATDPNFYHQPDDPIDLETDAGLKNLRGTIAMARTSAADSATSQFFINVVNNTTLDPTTTSDGYAVFGEVIEGMAVADEIAVLDTFTDSDIKMFFEALPVEPVIINSATVLRQFDSDSDDFSDVDFLRAEDGDIRTFRGQGAFAGSVYRHSFNTEEFLGISCLRWDQDASFASSLDNFTMLIARDTDDHIWILKYVLNEDAADEEVLVEATSLMEAVDFDDYADENMYFRLIAGDYNPNNLADAANTITTGTGDDIETEKIISFIDSIPQWPDYDDELTLVRWTQGPDNSDIRWAWYHESAGLVLDLWDNFYDPNLADPDIDDPDIIDRYGDGWLLADPNTMTNVQISLNAGNSRDDPSDSFTVTGRFYAVSGDFADSDVFLRVGPWHDAIDGADLNVRGGSIFTFNGSPQSGDGTLSLKFDTAHSRFSLVGRNVNLTGLAKPILVEIVVGSYYGQATALVKGNKPVSMKFLYGGSDALRSDRYVYVYDDHHNSDSMTITGSIASLSGAINLKNAKVTITWATSDIYSLPTGKFKQVGLTQKYVYINPDSNLKYAIIDWKDAAFKIRMAKSSISGPTKTLKIEIKNADSEVLFSKSVSVP